MTGFSRAESQGDGVAWTVEAKSVNGRNLDIRCRLPLGFESLEAMVRAEVARRFKRGSISITVTLTRTAATATQLRINRPLLDQLLALARDLAGAGAAPPRLDAVLAIRGVIETVDEGEDAAKRDQIQAQLGTDLAQALDRLAQARREEGARLGEILTLLLEDIAVLVASAADCAATQPAILRERLKSQLSILLEAAPALPEDRLAQELALLITRGDVREELDRLRAHIAGARELLIAQDAIGRRLDFLCQEFNREANTLCSKSTDVELTRIALALKATIEQFREQVQNIE
jgi:uncharacterized protein (TIGR00255 family)